MSNDSGILTDVNDLPFDPNFRPRMPAKDDFLQMIQGNHIVHFRVKYADPKGQQLRVVMEGVQHVPELDEARIEAAQARETHTPRSGDDIAHDEEASDLGLGDVGGDADVDVLEGVDDEEGD